MKNEVDSAEGGLSDEVTPIPLLMFRVVVVLRVLNTQGLILLGEGTRKKGQLKTVQSDPFASLTIHGFKEDMMKQRPNSTVASGSTCSKLFLRRKSKCCNTTIPQKKG